MSSDWSYVQMHMQERIHDVANQLCRPSVLYRPRVFRDGDMYCCLYGENLQEGLAAFGRTPSEAVDNFDFYVWHGKPEPELKP